jgi:UDP-N-acetylglucosamine--N-acetylmuramyl-(pentapeptide) pyrophosphoryl-undecaprenol N-acetylglucosamine transferase
MNDSMQQGAGSRQQGIPPAPFVAIACGGTGGHLFPGLAVAEQLVRRGCAVALFISPKEVDQKAVKAARGVEIFTLPAVAFQPGSRFAFANGVWQSWRAARKVFQSRLPCAALAMGGFTSAPPIVAAKQAGAKTFLHESNTIPGRANRWLARLVDQAFVGFPSAAARLRVREATVTGTPVRLQIQTGLGTGACRTALGLDPAQPVVLVMGGSQGASAINDLILAALPLFAKRGAHWQWLHLTGPRDADKARQTYASLGVKAMVHPFLAEMDLALGAATMAVSRAGASSLAELAAVRLPALLVPFPHAADNHQWHNAQAFAEIGAARMLECQDASPEKVSQDLIELMEHVTTRDTMKMALARWDSPKAAEQIAEIILQAVRSANLSPLPIASSTVKRTELRAPDESRLKAVA